MFKLFLLTSVLDDSPQFLFTARRIPIHPHQKHTRSYLKLYRVAAQCAYGGGGRSRTGVRTAFSLVSSNVCNLITNCRVCQDKLIVIYK